jgi:hypothetical protein
VNLQTATAIADNIVTSGAVIVGGTWAYFKFARGRIFAHRAEIDASSQLDTGIGSQYLRATVTLKNTGLSRLPLSKDMKVVRVSGLTCTQRDRPGIMQPERLVTLPILEQHLLLESQEAVTDTTICSLPTHNGKGLRYAAYQVDSLVGSRRSSLTGRGTLWQSRNIVIPPTVEAAQSGRQHSDEGVMSNE